MIKHSEADVAAVAIGWLESIGGDVYQEVELVARGVRADIVARVGAELWIVETKTRASLELLGQVMERRRFAHRVYAAAPHTSGTFGDLCTELGIGAISVHVGTDATYDRSHCDVVVESRRWNTRPVKLASRLRPEHKTACAAGSPTGGHWSRWRDTCAQIERVVAANPGIYLGTALGMIKHHYASLKSARGSLARDIERGKLPGVRFRAGGLWPPGAEPVRGKGGGVQGGR